MPALHRLRLHQVYQVLPSLHQLRERDPEEAKGGREPATALIADTSVVQRDGQLALCSQHTRGEHGLRQQQRPAESERVAGEFPDGAQDISNSEQGARNGTHESKDSTDSAGTETAQECPDRISGEHTHVSRLVVLFWAR